MNPLELDLRSLALLLQQQAPLASALEQISQRPGSQLWAEVAARVRRGAALAEAVQGIEGLPSWLGGWVDQGANRDPAEVVLAAAHCLRGLRQRQQAWNQLWLYPTLILGLCLIMGRWLLSATPNTAVLVGTQSSLITQINLGLKVVFPPLMLTPVILGALLAIPAVRVRLPLFGGLARLRDGLAVLQSLEFFVPGRTLPQALRLATEVGGLPPLMRQLRACADQMERGDGFSQALASAGLLSPTVAWMMIQAESSQFEPGVVRALAECLEEQIEFTQTFGWNLLHFGFYLYLGALVLWFMASTFLPLFGLMAL